MTSLTDKLLCWLNINIYYPLNYYHRYYYYPSFRIKTAGLNDVTIVQYVHMRYTDVTQYTNCNKILINVDT